MTAVGSGRGGTMSDAPERIWVDGDETGLENFLCWSWQRGSWNKSKEGVGEVEYIRCDLVPAPSVTVRPLEWDYDFAAVNIPEGYSAYDNGDGAHTVYLIWRTGIEKLNEAEFSTIEAAKAAAQADYEARIMAAIQVDPAPCWHPIETSPHETLVILGWRENGVWKQEIALASAGKRFPNGYSNRWWHSQATHWMPLPAPPSEGKQ